MKYDAEAILLLSDGAPNGNPIDIIDNISALNKNKKEIHTIAIGEYSANAKLVGFLQDLAKRNNGGFLGVSK